MATFDTVKASLINTYNKIGEKLGLIRKRLRDMGITTPLDTLSQINDSIALLNNTVSTAHSKNCQTWYRGKLPADFYVEDITYGNGMYVGLGYQHPDYVNGRPMYSTDGIEWFISPSYLYSGVYSSIAYGNEKFVAIPNSLNTSRYAISSDGINWTESLTNAGQTFDKVIFANGMFVIVGTMSFFLTSTDGTTWYQREAPESGRWISVAYSSGKFIAIKENSAIAAVSTDGVTWTSMTLPQSKQWAGIVSDNISTFIIYSSSNALISSDNGNTWEEFSSTMTYMTYGNNVFVGNTVGGTGYISYNLGYIWDLLPSISQTDVLKKFCYAGGYFYNLTYTGRIMYMSDAILPVLKEEVAYGRLINNGYEGNIENGTLMFPQPTEGWTIRTSPITANWYGSAYGYGMYVLIPNNGSYALTSPDAINWTQRSIPISGCTCLAFGNGKFVSLGTTGNVLYSNDGIVWASTTMLGLGFTGSWNHMIFADGKFYACGSYGTIISSIDGITWALCSTEYNGTIKRLCYGNNRYVATTSDSNCILLSSNGLTWTQKILDIPQDSSGTYAITYGNGMFVILAYNTNACVYSYDGITWSTKQTPLNAQFSYLVYGNGLFVGIILNTTNYLISSDGINWTIKNWPITVSSFFTFIYAEGVFLLPSTSTFLTTGRNKGTGAPLVSTGTLYYNGTQLHIYCGFKPDKVFLTLRGKALNGIRFCRINLSNTDKFKFSGSDVKSYSIYNVTGGTGGSTVSDLTTCYIVDDGFIFAPTHVDTTQYPHVYDYWAIGSGL